jgi:hypothetical protein
MNNYEKRAAKKRRIKRRDKYVKPCLDLPVQDNTFDTPNTNKENYVIPEFTFLEAENKYEPVDYTPIEVFKKRRPFNPEICKQGPYIIPEVDIVREEDIIRFEGRDKYEN